MFDDPKKELRRLEEALLAEEFQENVDRFDSDEDDNWEENVFCGSNTAVDFGRTFYDDEELNDDNVLYADTRSRREIRAAARKQKKEII